MSIFVLTSKNFHTIVINNCNDKQSRTQISVSCSCDISETSHYRLKHFFPSVHPSLTSGFLHPSILPAPPSTVFLSLFHFFLISFFICRYLSESGSPPSIILISFCVIVLIIIHVSVIDLFSVSVEDV